MDCHTCTQVFFEPAAGSDYSVFFTVRLPHLSEDSSISVSTGKADFVTFHRNNATAWFRARGDFSFVAAPSQFDIGREAEAPVLIEIIH